MWTCQKCSESIEGTLDVCWNCGTSADGQPDPKFVSESVDPNEQAWLLQNAACEICDGDEFEWGYLGPYRAVYKSEDAGLIESLTVLGGQSVRVRKCSRCRNLQLFVQ